MAHEAEVLAQRDAHLHMAFPCEFIPNFVEEVI